MQTLGRVILPVVSLLSLMWFLSSPSPEPLVTFIMAVAGIISTNKEPILKNVSRLIIAIGLVVSLIWSVDNPGFEPIIQAFTCALGIMATFTDSSNTIQRRGLPPKPIIRQPITTPRKIFTLILGVTTWVFVWHVALNWGFDSSEIQGLLGFIVFDEIGNYYPNSALGIGLWNCFIGIVFIGPLVQDLKDDNNDLILWGGMIGIGIGVINSWLISLYFLSQVDGFLYMIFALIFTHVILVGFIGTIGMGVFGLGVSLIWAATVAAITWLQRLVFRVI